MADGLCTAAVLGQILGKSIKRLVISPLGDKEQALLLQIVHHRDVLMAFAQDGLVDTDVAHAAHVKKGFSIEIYGSMQRVSQVIENAAVSAILTRSPRTGAESQVPCRTALRPHVRYGGQLALSDSPTAGLVYRRRSYDPLALGQLRFLGLHDQRD
jgi:hypothetical protein